MAIKQTIGGTAPDGSQYVTLTDGASTLTVSNATASGYPTAAASGVTALQSSSGNVAAATASATLAGAASKTTYLAGWSFSAGGATVGSIVNGTITGLLGGTQTFTVAVPTGATIGCGSLDQNYNPALPASAVNTPIVVSIPSLGAGNTNSTMSAWGYQV